MRNGQEGISVQGIAEGIFSGARLLMIEPLDSARSYSEEQMPDELLSAGPAKLTEALMESAAKDALDVV